MTSNSPLFDLRNSDSSNFSVSLEEIADLSNRSIRSLQEIESHLKDRRPAVLKLKRNELQSLGSLALSKFSNLKFLDVSDNFITSLQGTQQLGQLILLDASKNKMQALELEIPSLKRLLVSKNQITSIKVRSSMPQLILLDIHSNPITNLEFGNFFPSLSELYIDNCKIKSLSAIKLLPSLRHLTAASNLLTDTEQISHPLLSNLDISMNAEFRSLAPLAGIPCLTTLNVSGNPIANEGLKCELANLRNLRAARTPISDPSSCTFPSLETADFSFSKIDSFDLLGVFLEKCQKLRALDLTGSPITGGVYEPKGERPWASIFEYNKANPKSSDERMAYRLRVLRLCKCRIEMLDRVRVVDEEFMKINETTESPVPDSLSSQPGNMDSLVEKGTQATFVGQLSIVRPIQVFGKKPPEVSQKRPLFKIETEQILTFSKPAVELHFYRSLPISIEGNQNKSPPPEAAALTPPAKAQPQQPLNTPPPPQKKYLPSKQVQTDFLQLDTINESISRLEKQNYVLLNKSDVIQNKYQSVIAGNPADEEDMKRRVKHWKEKEAKYAKEIKSLNEELQRERDSLQNGLIKQIFKMLEKQNCSIIKGIECLKDGLHQIKRSDHESKGLCDLVNSVLSENVALRGEISRHQSSLNDGSPISVSKRRMSSVKDRSEVKRRSFSIVTDDVSAQQKQLLGVSIQSSTPRWKSRVLSP